MRTFAYGLLSLMTFGACSGPMEPPPPPPPADAGFDAGPDVPPAIRDVDILALIDNSNSMVDEQASFAAELPRLVSVLTTGDFDQDGRTDGPDDFLPVHSLNFGVVTTDMGTGGFAIPTCASSDFGDDGVLRTSAAAPDPSCASSFPPFLAYVAEPGADRDAFGAQAACLSFMGTGGCGFEQPLEAILKALSPSSATSWTADGYAPPSFYRGTSGHGDAANVGLIRENSALGIVVLTDENDCSAADPDIFNPTSRTYTAELNLRCFAHPTALHPISRFVDGLVQLRRDPSRLIFMPIIGIPVDLAPASGEAANWDALVSDDPALRDDRLEETIDPTEPNRLLPSCDVPDRGVAYPPIRILQVAEGLEGRGASVGLGSICQESLRNAFDVLIRRLGEG